MLEVDYAGQLARLMEQCRCEVVIPEQYRELFRRRGVVAAQDDDSRRFARFYFPARAMLELRSTLPGATHARRFHHILTKDVSRSGISFLHNGQLHPGDGVLLWLPDGKRPYTVVRCRRHSRRCFEIGAEFR